MSSLGEITNWLRDRLPALLAEHKVPGGAVAVSAGGQVADVAAGVLSKSTGVEATVDSVFQVGSITKVWTATLIMQLADAGKLDIDAPIRDVLPDFRVADEAASALITTRQLMAHTAGFEGDIFTDTGRGDDCVERYVATLGEVAQLFPPGEMFSYNNAGFCVLGRIVEVLREQPYDACLREHLFTPLGLTHVATSADEAILFRAAVGHVQPEPDADPQPAPIWSLVRSSVPAGSMLSMRPRDLLAFAQMHIDGGRAADGTTVLGPEAARAMRQPQVTLPPLGLMGTSWGLGWEIYDWPGGTVIGHDGGTVGQAAFLRVAPERDVAIALLTNGGNPIAIYTEIYPHGSYSRPPLMVWLPIRAPHRHRGPWRTPSRPTRTTRRPGAGSTPGARWARWSTRIVSCAAKLNRRRCTAIGRSAISPNPSINRYLNRGGTGDPPSAHRGPDYLRRPGAARPVAGRQPSRLRAAYRGQRRGPHGPRVVVGGHQWWDAPAAHPWLGRHRAGLVAGRHPNRVPARAGRAGPDLAAPRRRRRAGAADQPAARCG